MVEVFKNKGLRILLLTNALILISSAMLAPIYAFFIEGVGGDILDASFAGTAFALTAALTSFVTGKMSDKVREGEFVVILGYSLMALGYFLLIFVDSIGSLLFVQILLGFGEAIYSPSFDALYSKHLDKNKAGEEWGAWESTNYITIAAGALLGGLIANSFGFDFLFLIMGVISTFSAIYILLLPRKVL